MKILVIGGTSFIGRALAPKLVKAGHEVWIMHRRPKHGLGKKIGNLIADRNDPAAVKSAIGPHKFEAVFDNVYDWERGTSAAQVEAAARAVSSDRLQRYVFMSSVAAYGDGLNHHEGDALAPDDHAELYVRNKATTERMLFRMHQRNGFPVVTLRPPFIYGKGNPFYREAFFWDRLRDGRSIILPGDGRRLMQFVHIEDLVTMCARAIEAPDTDGHAFNVANPRPLTQLETIEAIARACNREPNIVRIPRDRILRAGGHPMGPKLYFGTYFDIPAITIVVNKAQRVLKFKPADFGEGLKETYRWYLRNNSFPKPDYAFEDDLLASAPAYVAEEF